MDIQLEAEQIEAFKEVGLEEVRSEARFQQRMADLQEQRRTLIVLILKQHGISSGKYSLGDDGTYIRDDAEAIKQVVKKEK